MEGKAINLFRVGEGLGGLLGRRFAEVEQLDTEVLRPLANVIKLFFFVTDKETR
jgi:hypothetical protein